MSNIKGGDSSLVNTAYQYERDLNVEPNLLAFFNKFNLNVAELLEKSQYEVKKICQYNYDRFWSTSLNESPKALSYILFKKNVCLEKYLYYVKNTKHRIALSRFRLSNHALLIEKGRHLRPPLERNERKCFICKNEIENEKHFLITCPLYIKERDVLFQTCRAKCRLFDSLISEEEKFIYIMTTEDIDIIKSVARFVSNSLKLRENTLHA